MKKKLNKTRHRKYDDQFNQEALKQVENGQSVAYVDQAIGISEALSSLLDKLTVKGPMNATSLQVKSINTTSKVQTTTGVGDVLTLQGQWQFLPVDLTLQFSRSTTSMKAKDIPSFRQRSGLRRLYFSPTHRLGRIRFRKQIFG